MLGQYLIKASIFVGAQRPHHTLRGRWMRGYPPAEAPHVSRVDTEPVKQRETAEAREMAEMPETVELGEAMWPSERGEPAVAIWPVAVLGQPPE